MADPFLGEIRLFAFDFPPQGWLPCEGQLLSIAQNQALFSLLGTYYGGDGTTNFRLPDLRGRVPVHVGNNINLGQSGGAESVPLTTAQLPAHTHPIMGSPADPTTASPVGALWAKQDAGYSYTANVQMRPNALATTGGGQGHENRQPYLTLGFCIATQGIYPPRS